MLVVQDRRAHVQIPPCCQMPRVGAPGTGHVEEDRTSLRVGEERPRAPAVRLMFNDVGHTGGASLCETRGRDNGFLVSSVG